MSRLSLIMGLFLALTVTTIIMLLAVYNNVGGNTILYRGMVIFFLFGFLGTVFGSFLEVVFIPVMTEKEGEEIRRIMKAEDDDLKNELGDLLEDDDDKKQSSNQSKSGTPTDESRSGTAISGSDKTNVS